MNIYLAKLKEKPFPNIKQKKGISVTLFSDKRIDQTLSDETKEPEKIEETEIIEKKDQEEEDETMENVEKKEEKKMCVIKDGRNKKTIERNQILETLKSNKIFAVKEWTSSFFK